MLNYCHVDMDAFYASIEERDNPSLKGKPIVVGGKSMRSVVSTANYEARKYGLYSSMPIFMAKKLCPHVIVLPVRMDAYIEESIKIFRILKKYSNNIEKISIDEAYLDLSNNKMDRLELAKTIKKDIYDHRKLNVSVGISYNKFLAKLGSDWNKPNGITIIDESYAKEILKDLPIDKVIGIGIKTQKRLFQLGIHKVSDMLSLDKEFFYKEFGKSGLILYNRIRGIDNRKIEANIERKSIGIERTLNENLKSKEKIKIYLDKYSKELEIELEKKGFKCKTIILKLKDENFKSITRSFSLDNYISSYEDIKRIAFYLLDNTKIEKPIRLIGLTCTSLIDSSYEQKSFLD